MRHFGIDVQNVTLDDDWVKKAVDKYNEDRLPPEDSQLAERAHKAADIAQQAAKGLFEGYDHSFNFSISGQLSGKRSVGDVVSITVQRVVSDDPLA